MKKMKKKRSVAQFDTKVRETFAVALKRARERKYSTAKEFAFTLDVEQHRYRGWERGIAAPDISMITRITVALQIEVAELMPLAWRMADWGERD